MDSWKKNRWTRNNDQPLLLEGGGVEENLEHSQPMNSEETHEVIADDTDYPDNFSDSSEEFNNAEQIENNNNGSAINLDSDSEDNNDDNSDSDSNDASSSNKTFFSINKSVFTFPFVSKSTFNENDHLLAIIAISMRNNLSFEATLSMLTWMKLTHSNNNLPTTKKALWKALHRDESLITRHLYCGICKENLGTGTTPYKNCSCQSCGPKKNSENVHYFLQLNLISQLSDLFKIPGIEKSLSYRFTREKKDSSAMEDIFDGQVYKNLSSFGNFLDNPSNYSFTINTDGCQVAKSSKASAWPIYFQINELPPHLRKKHMLLAGVFVDTCHPSLNLMLDPIVKELQKLNESGIAWKTSEGQKIVSKFAVTTCSVDSPARSLIMRMKQFNGYNGCSFCYAAGEYHGHKIAYPGSHSYVNLRTDEEIRRDMLIAYESKTVTNGIKGISALAAFPEFDLSNGPAVDSLHAVFLGAGRQHSNLFFTATDTPYYIGDPASQGIINNRLLSIKPPSRQSRLPRKLETFNNWKGSELRNWLDYAAPCLDGILDIKYIKHFTLLSQAVHIFNNDSISRTDLEHAENLIEQYVTQFEELFGLDQMSFNIHLLTHLARTVKNLGPMWVHNASIF
ncbi:uncharacterized protein LOC123264730 isoform X2 [Cotesia glomerata]|uniref:uncharacterized protein LOC123264730 isoform X2 n=1 Tax=Cotesia glomerata TaxID=32391 RepID=UPI001D02893A|nr:uncharacterized protein LOC123264730 isoform X2 [Cotesia glomerata]